MAGVSPVFQPLGFVAAAVAMGGFLLPEWPGWATNEALEKVALADVFGMVALVGAAGSYLTGDPLAVAGSGRTSRRRR